MRIINITNAKKVGEGPDYVGHCPCHDDQSPSLSIKFVSGRDNPLIHCFAGCLFIDLVQRFEELGCWSRLEGGRRHAFRI